MIIARVLNHLLAQAPHLQAELSSLRGKNIRLELPLLAATMVVTDGGSLADSQAQADASLTMTPQFFMTRLRDPHAAARLVQIAGDADIAAKAGNVLARLQWEAAEDASLWFGDIAAQRMLKMAQAMVRVPQDMGARMAVSLAEYCRDERQVLPRKEAVAAFCNDVDALRDDVARLEKRLQRLE